MRILAWVTIAAALTIILSPSRRNRALQAVFNGKGIRLPARLNAYADRPLPPAYVGPKMYTFKNGVKQ